VVVNQVHPRAAATADLETPGRALFAWLGERDAQGVADLQSRLGARVPLVQVPLAPREPADLEALAVLGEALAGLL